MDNDELFESNGFIVILNKELASKISVINIFFKSALSYDDFRISTDLIWKEEYYGQPWSKPW